MAKAFTARVFAANDLIEGDSVYLGARAWVRDIAEAAVASTPAEAEALADRAAAGERDNLVVGAYAVEVGRETGRVWPLLRREQIKASRTTTIPVGPAARLDAAA